jgi:hypothetical protein
MDINVDLCVFQVIILGKKTYFAYMVQFGILHIGFSQLFHMYFGRSREEFATFIQSMGSMLSVMLGGGANFKPGTAAWDDHFARTWIVLFAITMTYIFSSMFVSIVTDLISCATKELNEVEEINSFHPIDYFRQKSTITWRSLKKQINSVRNWWASLTTE